MLGITSKVRGSGKGPLLLLDLLHLEVQKDLVKPVVELVSVSVEEVGFSDLYLVVVPRTGDGGYALVSVSRRHVVS